MTVTYYYDEDVGNYNYHVGHYMKPHRIRMAHNLVMSYGLDKYMDVLEAPRASAYAMTRFHTDEYIEFLQNVTPETVQVSDERFIGSGSDCPVFEGLFEFCSISAGGSMAAAERLNQGQADVAINWAGGLHHAKRREASGFCYVNDIVLACLDLLRVHERVLYIDIDVHHGDGVEEAFYTTDRVMTCSFHLLGKGFFPGTGHVIDQGIKKGKNYSVNFPLLDGITDETYASVFEPVIRAIMEWYRPGAVVLQCGADSLAGDRLGKFNLSLAGHAKCVSFVQSFHVPLMLLGGGGYTIKNVARCWTNETAVVLGIDLEKDLPYHNYFDYYGPLHKLEVPPTNRENKNTRAYLDKNLQIIIDQLREMPFAPSTQHKLMPEGPRDEATLEDEGESDLDQRLERAKEHRGGIPTWLKPIRAPPEGQEDVYNIRAHTRFVNSNFISPELRKPLMNPKARLKDGLKPIPTRRFNAPPEALAAAATMPPGLRDVLWGPKIAVK